MEINKVIEDKCATVALSGRLDTLTSPQLEEALRELPADITKLVIDLKDLEYVSSAGLRVFLNAQKSMMEKGEDRFYPDPDNRKRGRNTGIDHDTGIERRKYRAYFM